MRHPFLFVLALHLVSTLAACTGSEGDPRRVIVISLDTLRPDHLGIYGYARPTSPHLDRRFGERGTVFDNAFAQASWTLPSHVSLFTGLTPEVHGVVDLPRRLPSDTRTLAEILQEDAFATAAFTDGGFVSAEYGLGRGFDVYHESPEHERGLEHLLPLARSWIADHADEDFFLFLHTYDVHAPYEPPARERALFQVPDRASDADREQLAYLASMVNLDYLDVDRYRSIDQIIADYDAGIRAADERLESFWRFLEEEGLYDDSVIVVLSDHGESFLDANVYVGHGIFLYDHETRIPLLVRFPGDTGSRRVDAMVESIDVMPTLLEKLGIRLTASSPVQGLSLLPLVRDPGADWPKQYAFSSSPPWHLGAYAVHSPQWTLQTKVSDDRIEDFFKWRLEPKVLQSVRDRVPRGDRLVARYRPRENHLRREPEAADMLRAALEDWLEKQATARQLILHPELRTILSASERRQLESLGYGSFTDR